MTICDAATRAKSDSNANGSDRPQSSCQDDELMTQAENSVTSRIGQWASRQLADYDAHTPGSVFAGGVVLNVAEGYELQSAVAELRQRRGERIIGYKVGCTSSKIRAQLGIDHCVTGRLYNSERHASGAVLSRSKYANLAIKGELAREKIMESKKVHYRKKIIFGFPLILIILFRLNISAFSQNSPRMVHVFVAL